MAANWNVWLPLTSDNVQSCTIRLPATPKTWYLHLKFHCYLVYQLRYKYFRFGRPPSWISDCRSRRTMFEVAPLECPTPKTWYLHFKFRCYLVYQLRYKYFRFGRPPSWISDCHSRRIMFGVAPWKCPTPKTWYLHLKFRCYLVYNLRYKYFRFGRPPSWISEFRLRLEAFKVFHWNSGPQKIRVAFVILFLSIIQPEIHCGEYATCMQVS